MCKVMEDMRNTAWNEGKVEGIKENAIETAKLMIRKGKYSISEIMEISGLPLEKIEELAGA